MWPGASVILRSLLVIRLGESLWAHLGIVVPAAGTLGVNFSGVALPANQSLERTGHGHRGSLRSAGIHWARRSTQIRWAAVQRT